MIEVVGVEAWDIESKVEEEATEEITFLESRRKNPVVGSSNLTSKPEQPGKFFPPPPEKQNTFLCQNAYDKGSYLITVVGKGDRHRTQSRELPTVFSFFIIFKTRSGFGHSISFSRQVIKFGIQSFIDQIPEQVLEIMKNEK